MAYALDPAAVALAFGGGATTADGTTTQFRVVEVGRLKATTGRLVAADPLVMPETPPFRRRVPTGDHPVEVAVAELGSDKQIAFARVRFAAGVEPATWELATADGQDASPSATAAFGYGVDSGTGCFMDAATADLLIARMDEEPDYGIELAEALEVNYRHTWTWLEVRPDASRDETVVCFSSGWGDGSYPTFFGLDADGGLVTAVTDFMLLGAEGDDEDETGDGEATPLGEYPEEVTSWPPPTDGRRRRRRLRLPWRR